MKLTPLCGNILTNNSGRFVALKGVSLDNPQFEEHPDLRKLEPGEDPIESKRYLGMEEVYITPWWVWFILGWMFGLIW